MSRILRHEPHKRFLRPAVIAALACVTIIAACGGAPGAGTPNAPANSALGASQPPAVSQAPTLSLGGGAAPTEMCPLISGEDVATIVGKDLAETTPGANAWCTWTFTDRTPGAFPGIGGTVIVRYDSDDTQIEHPKNAFPGGEDVTIADRGYWTDDFATLYFVKGAHLYAVQLVQFDAVEPRKDMAIQVAQLLLAKL